MVVGDFVLVAKDVLKKYLRTDTSLMANKSHISMEQVDILLENLAKISFDTRGDTVAGGYKKAITNTQQSVAESGIADQFFSSQVTVMVSLLNQITIADFEWIVRIILKDLKCGLNQEKILELYHPDSIKVLNTVSNLQDICEACLNPDVKVEKFLFRLFTPLRPYLAKRVNPEKLSSYFTGANFLIEEKFDGERIQLHFDEK